MSRKIAISVCLDEFHNENDLDEVSRALMKRARMVCDQAYAPYSNFQVGAALLLENGEVVIGTNQENAAYPSGLCAERVALFSAASNFPGVPIKSVAISAKKSGKDHHVEVTPCGGCRQVMIEYQSLQPDPIRVLMEGPTGKVYEAKSVDMLLPFKFSSNSLL